VCCVTARTRLNAQFSTIAARSEKRREARSSEKREAARGMASRNWICRVEYSAAAPGVSFGYLARLQRAFAAKPRA
jgi:hypothetical protein